MANYFYTSGTKIIKDYAYDWTVVYYGPDENVVNLPNSISYSDADYKVKGNYSGAAAKFQYGLPGNVTNYVVWPQGQIQYSTQLRGSIVPVYYWTGTVGISHTVNSK